MPTYDYQCAACGHRFEEFQTMSAKTLRKCPACKKQKLERLIGAGAGVIFKGSGFYQTDYRPSAYSADAKKDESSGSSAGGTSAGGTASSSTPASGCAPACGTDKAPAGCKMPKKKD